jgi:hypothetical protein
LKANGQDWYGGGAVARELPKPDLAPGEARERIIIPM